MRRTNTSRFTQRDQAGTAKLGCPHRGAERVVRSGQADGLQRHKCGGCGKTFEALTAASLARLGQRHKWLAQVRVLDEGLSVHQAAEGPCAAVVTPVAGAPAKATFPF